MNTVRSVGYGWAVLILAGGGSYYFAKRSINSDREERAAAEERRRQAQYRLRASESYSRDAAMTGPAAAPGQDRPSPSAEGVQDPAPAAQDSRFEASTPFRSKKGDRFS